MYIGAYHAIVCLSNNVLFGRVSGSDLACNVLYAGLEGCGYPGTACGCLCTSLASADPIARLCAYFRMALAIALAAAAAQACAV